jgi:hypothetical protein
MRIHQRTPKTICLHSTTSIAYCHVPIYAEPSGVKLTAAVADHMYALLQLGTQ